MIRARVRHKTRPAFLTIAPAFIPSGKRHGLIRSQSFGDVDQIRVSLEFGQRHRNSTLRYTAATSRRNSKMRRSIALAFSFAILTVAAQAQTRAGATAAVGCDRECLRGFITQYLDALIAHNPKAFRPRPPCASRKTRRRCRWEKGCGKARRRSVPIGKTFWTSVKASPHRMSSSKRTEHP